MGMTTCDSCEYILARIWLPLADHCYRYDAPSSPYDVAASADANLEYRKQSKDGEHFDELYHIFFNDAFRRTY